MSAKAYIVYLLLGLIIVEVLRDRIQTKNKKEDE